MKAETALEAINAALFPRPEKGKSGVMIDRDAYYNLEGLAVDLEHRGLHVEARTARAVQAQIHEVSKVLQKANVK